MIVMVENRKIKLPPYNTCQLCRNRMNDSCMEVCTPAGDYSSFELRKGVNIEEMPRFPLEDFMNGMPAKVRGIVVAVYLSKIVDQLQGRVEHERHDIYRPRGSGVPENIQIQDLLLGVTQGDPAHEDRTQCANPAIGSDQVAGQSDNR